MPKLAAATPMIDLVADAIANADGAHTQADPGRYRRLALAALRPLAKPSARMIDAAHEAVASDGFWAINSRRDFQKAVTAMVQAALKEGAETGLWRLPEGLQSSPSADRKSGPGLKYR